MVTKGRSVTLTDGPLYIGVRPGGDIVVFTLFRKKFHTRVACNVMSLSHKSLLLLVDYQGSFFLHYKDVTQDKHIAGGIQRWHSILFLVILD